MATLDISKIGNTLSLNALPAPISSKSLSTPTVVSAPKTTDNTNYAGILANAQQQALALQQIAGMNQAPASQTNPNANYFGTQTTQSSTQPTGSSGGFDIKSYIDSISGVQQPSATQTYQQSYNDSGLSQLQADVNAKSAITAEAQGRLNNISAQLQALNAEATAVPIAIQSESEGRGRTAAGVAPLEADKLREIALRALPLQSEAAVVQAQVANAAGQQQLAQDLYKQAESKFNQLFQLQMEDANRRYETQINLIDKVFSFADRAEQRQLSAIKEQADRDYQAKQDEIKYQREAALIRLRQQPTSTTTSEVPQTFEEQIADLKLSTGQKSDLVDIQTLEEQLSKLQAYADDGELAGTGSLGVGTLKQGLFTIFGAGSEEGADVRTLIGNLKGQIAKLRGGTSFTANEEKLLDSYVPGINESTESIMAKVRGLQDFLASKKNAIIQVGGGSTITTTDDPLGIL